jgi:hypothetical protein
MVDQLVEIANVTMTVLVRQRIKINETPFTMAVKIVEGNPLPLH